MVATMIIGD